MKSLAVLPVLLSIVLLWLPEARAQTLLYAQLDSQFSGAFGLTADNFIITTPGLVQVADDFDVPAGTQWTLTAASMLGFVVTNTSTNTMPNGTIQIWSSAVIANPDGNPPTFEAPSQLLYSFTSNLTFPFQISNMPQNYNLNFNFATKPIVLTPGRYWISTFVTCSANKLLGWASSSRNVTAANNTRGNLLRWKDVNDIFAQGFLNLWVGPMVALGFNAETFFSLTGNSSVYVTPSASTGTNNNVVAPTNITAIGAGVGGGIALLLIVALVVAFLIWRRRQASSLRQDLEMTHDSALRPGSYLNSPVSQSRTGNYAALVVATPGNSVRNNLADSSRGTLPASPYANIPTDQLGIQEININELKFDKQIGSGSFGVVFKGTWRGGAVAIKQVMDKLNQSDMDSFRAEAKLMSSLRPHVNVVQFLGVSFGENSLCIVTEFMDGGSLYDFLASDAKLDFNMVALYAKGIAAGMLHLHSENIVHRDLASRNVLLGAGAVVKISDFGMSRTVGSSQKANQTKSNTGPLKWMAPESIKKREYSPYSDLWSFGVTLWEIMSREEPYIDYDALQVAVEVVNGNPPLRLQIPPITPPILKEVMQKCFQTNPADRGSFKEINERFQKSKISDWAPVITG